MSESEKETIKCWRQVFDLADGDTVMDNGACYQLVSRKVSRGWNSYSPTVSKAAFRKFKENPKVQVVEDHSYGPKVTLYRYTDKES